jgi:putative hemolysin
VIWLDLALVGVLVLVNALFSGSEMALISLREGQLRQLERSGGARATRLASLARDPNRYLATIQIGITLAGFLASATAAASLADPLVPSLGFLGSWARPVAIGGITLVLTFVTLVLGELAPKRLARQRALPWALAVAGPIDLLSRLSRPAVALLAVSTNGVVRLLGGAPQAAEEEISPAELRDLVLAHKLLDSAQREIITGALDITGRTLREVLVPRRAVFSIPASLPADEALAALAAVGHSRAPVTDRRHLDDVVGIAHWSALLRGGPAKVRTVAAEPLLLPDTLSVSEALRRMRAERSHLAVVLDEYGSVDGIVTLEDLLEEVVGEIYDETDRDLLTVERDADGSLVLPGTYPLHDLRDIAVDLGVAPSRDHTTVAGLVVSRLGRVPRAPGDVVEVGGWRLEVLAVAGHAVTAVRLRPLPATHGEPAGGSEPGDQGGVVGGRHGA